MPEEDDPAPEQLTVWLRRMSEGDEEAGNLVAGVVYRELKRQAAQALSGEYRDHSLQPTVIVNEAFTRLLKAKQIDWLDRNHFFSLTARMMRRVITDHFRQRDASKRPRSERRVDLENLMVFADENREQVLIVDEALGQLGQMNARLAQIVELRYFGGLTVEEVSAVLGLTERTVKRDWQLARWWLKRHLGDSSDGDSRHGMPLTRRPNGGTGCGSGAVAIADDAL